MDLPPRHTRTRPPGPFREPVVLSEGAAEALHAAFGAFGLTPYQARVLVSLLRMDCGTCMDIASVAGVPRTSIYQILDELEAKDLACRLPGPGPAVWASVGHRDTIIRLVATEERRLIQLKDRAARVEELLQATAPSEGAAAPSPSVHVIHDPGRVAALYEQLLRRTQEELLVFNRPPYFSAVGRPRPVVLDTCRRVRTRVLYQRAQVVEQSDGAWKKEMAAYHEAGAEGRVVDELPMKLAVFDRKVALVTLADSHTGEGVLITMLVEHPQFGAGHASAFEVLWSRARPYDS